MGLTKMTITGYEKSSFTGGTVATFEAQINPSEIKLNKVIKYRAINGDGTKTSEGKDSKFVGHTADTLLFDLTLDDTGVILENKGSKGNIETKIKQLEKILYNINSDSHEPSYVKITWGGFEFKGRLTSLNYNYTMFRPDGSALRVKISLAFCEHLDREAGLKELSLQSPDLSRIIIIKAGESIAAWCNEIYDDPSYCIDVASYNGLNSFRGIKPGTRLMFPPLANND